MKAFILGAGAQGRVILDILRDEGGHERIEFLDDNAAIRGTEINGARIRGTLDELLAAKPRDTGIIVALGNPLKRVAVAAKIRDAGLRLLNAVHPSAVVMPTACLGVGIMIGATAVVNTNAKVGDNVIINTGAVVEHDCVLGEGSAVSPGAHLGGRATLGSFAFVATGAMVLSRVKVGEAAVIAAGSVVTRDVAPHTLIMGVPGRVVRELGSEFDWTSVL